MNRKPNEDEVAQHSKELAAELERAVVAFSGRMAAMYGVRNAVSLAMTGITAHTATLCAKLTCGDDPAKEREKAPGAEDEFFAHLVQSCKVFMPLARRMLADACNGGNGGPHIEVELPRDRYIN